MECVSFWDKDEGGQRTTFQIILEALDMLAKAVEIQEQDLEEQLSKEELSKEAKKELVLKYQDKGYEH